MNGCKVPKSFIKYLLHLYTNMFITCLNMIHTVASFGNIKLLFVNISVCMDSSVFSHPCSLMCVYVLYAVLFQEREEGHY